MADLLDFQFDLDGYVFGVDCEVFVEPTLSLGEIAWTNQDFAVPQAGARRFGVDYEDPGVWTFDLGVNGTDEWDALPALGRAAAFWRASDKRRTPGAFSTLRYQLAGRTRRVYGRPGRFKPALENRLLVGYIPIGAQFTLADSLFYDDVQKVRTMSLVAAEVGGWQFPLVFPLTSSNERTERNGLLNVGGDQPTWATVKIKGPGTNLKVDLGKWAAHVPGTLAADQAVIFDSRPWVRTIRFEAGGSAAAIVSPGTRLRDMLLEPGAQDAVFSGTDPTGTATATVSWHDAYGSL